MIPISEITLLSNSFAKFMSQSQSFLQYVGKGVSYVSDLKDCFTEDAKNILSSIIPKNFTVKASVGCGRVTGNPWLAIFNRDISTSAQRGIYLVFLFSSNLQSLYLTLNQGTTKGSKDEIARIIRETRAQFPHLDYLQPTDIGEKGYRNAAIFSYKWDFGNQEANAIALSDFIRIYSENSDFFIQQLSNESTTPASLQSAKPTEPSPSKIESVEHNLAFEPSNVTLSKPIDKYINYFTHLHTNIKEGRKAPHKAILLISIIDLIEKNRITSNEIDFAERISSMFLSNWKRYVGESIVFKPDAAKPFWHMDSEPFWNNKFTTAYSSEQQRPGKCPSSNYNDAISKCIKWAEINQELYDLLLDETNRAKLRVALISSYL